MPSCKPLSVPNFGKDEEKQDKINIFRQTEFNICRILSTRGRGRSVGHNFLTKSREKQAL